MKHTSKKKPRAKSVSGAAVPPGSGTPKRKRRRKKPGIKERILAVAVAAAFIAAALTISLAVTRRRAGPVAETPVEAQAETVLPSAKTGAPEENSARAPAVDKPLPVQSAPAITARPATTPTRQPAASQQPTVRTEPSAQPEVSTRPATVQQPATRQRPAASATPEESSRPAPAVSARPAAPQQPAARPEPSARPATPVIRQQPAASPPPAGVAEQPRPGRAALVFVIDDAGNNLRDLEPFLALRMPLTIAVLPGLAYSAEAARRIRAAGKEVFLHQPMEPLGGQNPGPGAITAGMGREEITAVINRNLAEVGPVAGINNHEGSRVTMDEEAMETVLAVCREKGIVFLDSRTTAETAAPTAARRLGITIGERDIFVDNEKDRESMRAFINSGLGKADQKGSAVMIGHAGSRELAPLLAEMYPDLEKRGYSFSQMSKIIR